MLLGLWVAVPAACFERGDGTAALHGFYRMELRTLSDGFEGDHFYLSQWAHTLNLELELDLAPRGFGPFELVQGFAESTGLPDASVDAALITLVFHECPDKIKETILAEVLRILRPGGTLVLSDTPNDDLHDYRGFYEPYKEQWLHFDPEATLAAAGFDAALRRPEVSALLDEGVNLDALLDGE